jgi:hypothetical protein
MSQSDKLSSKAVLGILTSFPRKAMNTKVEDNFMAHNQFCIIWSPEVGDMAPARKGCESRNSR